MAEETCGFYAGVVLVVTGMIFIVGMGVYSIYNPLEGEEINNPVVSLFWFKYWYSVPACGEPEKLSNGEIVVSQAEVDIPDKNKTIIFFTCNTGKLQSRGRSHVNTKNMEVHAI